MKKAATFWLDGIEEVEAVTPVDLLRRVGIQVQLFSLENRLEIVGKQDIRLTCDALISDYPLDADLIFFPGGTIAYLDKEEFLAMLREEHNAGKHLAAICAAPAVFGRLGFLQGKKAICYPGMESYLTGATVVDVPVITDGNITTSKGPGTAVAFGLELVRLLTDQSTANILAKDFIVE